MIHTPLCKEGLRMNLRVLNKRDTKIISFRSHVENPVWLPGSVSLREVSYGNRKVVCSTYKLKIQYECKIPLWRKLFLVLIFGEIEHTDKTQTKSAT